MSEREMKAGKSMIEIWEELATQEKAVVTAFAQGIVAATVSREREQKEGTT